MERWKQWILLGLILLAALVFRWTGIDWDGYHHFHPDERYITWVATTIEWPASLTEAVSSTESPLNPFYWYPGAASAGIRVPQDEPRDFTYGHIPLYLGVATTRLVERLAPAGQSIFPADWLITTDIFNTRAAVEFRHLTAVSRALTGLVDVATIYLLFLLGRRLFGPAVGLLAAAFLALNVMHIQLAHFFIVDPYLAFFGLAALTFMVHAIYTSTTLKEGGAVTKGWRCSPTCNLLIAAIFTGLAVGAKFSALLLLLPLVTAVLLTSSDRRYWRLFVIVVVVMLTFVITNPFTILDQSCELLSPAMVVGPVRIPSMDWGSCYLSNIFTQGAMVRGQFDLGFTRQYDGTIPYLYYIEMQLRWGMGWALGLLAFVAFAWAIWITARPIWRRISGSVEDEPGPLPALTLSMLILLLFALPFFLITGSFYVKFMRYLQPLTPLLMLFAAAFIFSFKKRWLRVALLVIVLLPTAVYALSFMNIYRFDHPWEEASRWVYANVEPATLIASEQWDDTLPTSMIVDDQMRRRHEYRNMELTWLTGPDARDNEVKLVRNLKLLEQADYITLTSNRIYGVVPRLEGRYPLSSVYHQLMFDGTLGYEPVFVNTRMPGLFGAHLQPDAFNWPGVQPPPEIVDYLARFPGVNGGRFDESFTVYDQPMVMIFENVDQLTAVEMRQYFP